MSQEQTFYIVNKDVAHNAKAAIDQLDTSEGMVVNIEKPRRSKAQNRLYWKCWVETLMKHFGASKNQIHEDLRDYFLQGEEYTSPFTGEVKVIRPSTRELTVKEFSSYLEDIEAEMWHKWGIVLPRPEDYRYAVYGIKPD